MYLCTLHSCVWACEGTAPLYAAAARHTWFTLLKPLLRSSSPSFQLLARHSLSLFGCGGYRSSAKMQKQTHLLVPCIRPPCCYADMAWQRFLLLVQSPLACRPPCRTALLFSHLEFCCHMPPRGYHSVHVIGNTFLSCITWC